MFLLFVQAKKFREYLYYLRHCVIEVMSLHGTSKGNKGLRDCILLAMQSYDVSKGMEGS